MYYYIFIKEETFTSNNNQLRYTQVIYKERTQANKTSKGFSYNSGKDEMLQVDNLLYEFNGGSVAFSNSKGDQMENSEPSSLHLLNGCSATCEVQAVEVYFDLMS